MSEHLTDPEDEIILYGVLGFAPRRAQGTARSLGSFLFLARGFPPSLCPIRGACGWGGVGCRVSRCGCGRRHLETAEDKEYEYAIKGVSQVLSRCPHTERLYNVR